jgi:O-antigen biosynthesis protein
VSRVSVVIPVLNGERYLEEILEALAREGVDETLVIDSGSRDRSVPIARSAGVTVLEIPPAEFGHGRTRNLGAERTSGELVCFLTQDATPCTGWLEAYVAAFALASSVGAAYGPHMPRPGTSPMIARELTEFFASFSPEGRHVVQRNGDPSFLSNVNACYTRSCWEEIRFRELAYSEDQAFGRDLFEHGWSKVYHPGAAVLHAHDYGAAEFMQRYFDEYRGLRGSIGHVEPFGLRSTLRDVRTLVGHDRRWMREHDYAVAARAGWTARSIAHHTGRKGSAALGSRAGSLPASMRRRLSHEGADYVPEPDASVLPSLPLKPQEATAPAHEYEQIARVLGGAIEPLADAVPGMADRGRLHVAFLIPPFTKGSGGHTIIFQLMLRIEQRGHTCSAWLDDPFGYQHSEWPALLRHTVREHFAPVGGPLFKGFDDWYGADVVVATGWQTVYPALDLEGVRARVYLVNDHEPEFYPTSVESIFAAETYRLGLHGICGSPWLRDLYTHRYGGVADVYDYGVDHHVYKPRPVERERDTVVFYCRTTTQRRAVALGIMALHELKRRRPQVRIIMFGERHAVFAPFAYEHAGIASPEQLSWLYSKATVGLCLSLTNYSLIPQEMLACGLPCVDLQGASAESVFGADGPVELAPFGAVALADHVERMLADADLWERRSRAGLEFVEGRTWDHATDQVEGAMRRALRARELSIAGGASPPPSSGALA